MNIEPSDPLDRKLAEMQRDQQRTREQLARLQARVGRLEHVVEVLRNHADYLIVDDV